MQRRWLVALASVAVVSVGFAEGQTKPKESPPARQDLGTITVQPPGGWKSVPPSSAMRKAQYVLPKVAGDAEDAELVVFNFGAGQGGGVEENLKRWEGQFENASKPKIAKKKVAGMNVTTMDISGTYKQQAMGGPFVGGEVTKKPNFRMLAAIVEAPDSSYFFKLTGPAKTVAKWEKSFHEFVDSVRKK
ncbi:MAG: hypothetical protein NZT92_11840 [Abditibacteriales bacterium]|nr:hypothetical protein [Abditibacteriales bacterium]MDW8364230.1 hypothetical protein [Abditibacteriales bacterium]